MRSVVNFVAFQIGWFAAVLGAGHGMPWLGVVIVPLVLLVNLVLSADRRQELVVALVAAVMGFVVDTGLVAAGVFAPVPFLVPRPFSPLWMVMLWVNQATTLNGCMAWLRGRYLAGCPFRRRWGTSRLSQRCEAWRGKPALNPRSRHLGNHLGVCFPGAAGGGRVRAQALGCARGMIGKSGNNRSAGYSACPRMKPFAFCP